MSHNDHSGNLGLAGIREDNGGCSEKKGYGPDICKEYGT